MPRGVCDCKMRDPHDTQKDAKDLVDIGDDHLMQFFHLSSDYGKTPDGAVDWSQKPTGPPAGVHVWHQKEDGYWCVGSAYWRHFPSEMAPATWTLHSLDPLHIEPSLLCHCGDHGFIRGGRWEAV